MNFTSDGYQTLLERAAKRFSFVRFGDFLESNNIALWRHDVDFSPQRALKMARQEAALSLTVTYFVQLTSRYYSVLEPETSSVIRSIHNLGHEVGLHFDPEGCQDKENRALEERLRFEADILSKIIEIDIRVFSLHNPTTISSGLLDKPFHAGLLNASASELYASFTYCSDSNGIWRYDSLDKLIADPETTKLYALTHPEWWQEMPMLPRERILRSINGRSEFCLRYYDSLLRKNSRPNVVKTDDFIW